MLRYTGYGELNRPVASIFQGGFTFHVKLYIYIYMYLRTSPTYVRVYVRMYVRTYLNKDIISTVNYTNRGLYIIFICNRTNTNYRGVRPLRTNSFACD